MTCTEVHGAGCVLRIHFPLVGESDRSTPHKVSGVRGEHRGSTILIVDDEVSVRETAEEMLTSMGYLAVACSGGQEALKLMQSRNDEIAFVLLDITMPDMSGHEVIREIARLHPDTDVILTSGFSERMMMESRDNPCYRGFLKKPYSMDELREAVERVMA
jgi:DNA-binding NtrC family response regulator